MNMGVCQLSDLVPNEMQNQRRMGCTTITVYSFISYQFGIVLFYVSGKFFYFCSVKFAKISVLRDLKVLDSFIFKIFMVYKID